jgi:hypothetical protein
MLVSVDPELDCADVVTGDVETGDVVTGVVVTGVVVTGVVPTGVVVTDVPDTDVVVSTRELSLPHAKIPRHAVTPPISMTIRDVLSMFGNLVLAALPLTWTRLPDDLPPHLKRGRNDGIGDMRGLVLEPLASDLRAAR